MEERTLNQHHPKLIHGNTAEVIMTRGRHKNRTRVLNNRGGHDGGDPALPKYPKSPRKANRV